MNTKDFKELDSENARLNKKSVPFKKTLSVCLGICKETVIA